MRTPLILFALATALCLQAPSTQGQNLLTNGNLDLTQATEIVPGFFLPKPTAWQNFGTRTISGPFEDEMSSEPWAGPAPTPVTVDGLANPPHPGGCGGGDCGVFFKPFTGNATDGPVTARLFQDVPGTPGATYTFSLWAGAEANFLGGAEMFMEFRDGGGTLISGFGHNLIVAGLLVPNGEPFNYKQYTRTATAPAGTATVRVTATMIDALANPLGGGQAFVVDDFVLTVVPEPSTLALGLAGLVGLAAFAKRRR